MVEFEQPDNLFEFVEFDEINKQDEQFREGENMGATKRLFEKEQQKPDFNYNGVNYLLTDIMHKLDLIDERIHQINFALRKVKEGE